MIIEVVSLQIQENEKVKINYSEEGWNILTKQPFRQSRGRLCTVVLRFKATTHSIQSVYFVLCDLGSVSRSIKYAQ